MANYGAAKVTDVTISGNFSANAGGGMVNTGTATLANTIVAGNTTASGGPDVYRNRSLPTATT